MLNRIRRSFPWTLIISSSVFFSMINWVDADTQRDQQSPSKGSETTLVLNQAQDPYVTARSLKHSNGSHTFESQLKMKGMSITEQVHQHANGRAFSENKIVVNLADNRSVEFVQQFDAEGRRVSRSVIKRPPGKATRSHKSIVASKGGVNDLAIEDQTIVNADGRTTTTTVSSNDFSLNSDNRNWMLIASAGYDHFAHAMDSDGSTGVARLALNRSFLRSGGFDFGLEAGIQNGVSMKPVVQQSILDALGGTSLLATIKPVIELLPTLSRRFADHSRFLGFVKLGMAYRTMTFTRDTIPSISKISPDLHLGLAAAQSDHVSLMIYYHAIFGGNPNINATMLPLPANNLGKAANIPTQQGVLLGVSYSF